MVCLVLPGLLSRRLVGEGSRKLPETAGQRDEAGTDGHETDERCQYRTRHMQPNGGGVRGDTTRISISRGGLLAEDRGIRSCRAGVLV